VSGYSPQTRSLHSSGSIRSRSALRTFVYTKDQASLPHDGVLEKTRHYALMTYPG